jgi:hypothetical protein
MLVIVNVTKENRQERNDYEVRVNNRVIATFQHDRCYNGAAQCLRDAADAVEKLQLDRHAELLESLLPMFKRMKDG